MSFPDESDLDTMLRAALDLDAGERAYLAGLDLAATWRSRPATATDTVWGWLALFVVLAGFVAWTVAAEPLGDALSTAGKLGVSTVVLTTAVGLLLHAGQTLIDLSSKPALGLSQPLLAMLALALLFWPRLTSKSLPPFFQGV
jgi:hypothetical protein